MTFKLAQIAAMVDGGAIAKLDRGTGIPWKQRFACARVIGAVLDAYQNFAKLRDAAVRRYGLPDAAKGQIAVSHPDNTAENVLAFHTALADLLNTDVPLDVPPLSLTALTETSELTPGDIHLLGALITE